MTAIKEGSRVKFAETPVNTNISNSPIAFITWFIGFVDAIGNDHPTESQWKTIINKISQIK